MGNRLATIDMGRKVGGCCALPLSWGAAGSPSNTVDLAETYSRIKWQAS